MAQRIQDYNQPRGRMRSRGGSTGLDIFDDFTPVSGNSGGGIFGDVSPSQMMMASQLGGAIGDIGTRMSKGEVAEVEAATAPFARGSILDMFEQGPQGSDPVASLAEGYALGQKMEERDRIQELLKNFGARAAGKREQAADTYESTLEEAKNLRRSRG